MSTAWLPWGEAAFERARAEDRPILLDIGAVWCHWCHVMDRESYRDPDTSALINELYIPIKVDRDDRPDIDARYQRAVQLLTGQGGWPLTVFLTPSGEAYYGGTYFPPRDAHGRPSFTRVLREAARVWREDRPRALEAAAKIGERLDAASRAEVRPGDPQESLIGNAIEELAQSFDFRHGGFGHAPKFPNAGALDLLLDEYLDADTPWARRIVDETLVAMVDGGIHDQIGGGFHRYSTDARWIIPHFEKMAYDNGVLLATLARAYAVLGLPQLRDAAAGVIAYYHDVAPDMLRTGGFPASQDADHSPDDDGDYWTWTTDEIRSALADDDLARIALLHYGFDDHAGAMHLDPSRHVLFQAVPAAQLAERHGVDAARVEEQLHRIRSTLKRARDNRVTPYIDMTPYTGWIALVASGFLAAERHAGLGAAATALRALERIVAEGFDADTGVRHRVGDASSGVHLEDQAHVLLAFVDAFEFSQDAVWLERAAALASVLHERFRDPATGALRDLPTGGHGVAALDRAYYPIADAPAPSGNGAAALGLLRLHAYTGDQRAYDDAVGILRAFAGAAGSLASSAATYMKALAWWARPVTTVVVVEEEGGPLWQAALASYRARTILRRYDPDVALADRLATGPALALPAELVAMVGGDAPRGYVCTGRTCAAPVEDGPALSALLRAFPA